MMEICPLPTTVINRRFAGILCDGPIEKDLPQLNGKSKFSEVDVEGPSFLDNDR